MRKFLIAASVAVLCATPALAGDEIMASTYGNTVVSTGGGSEARTHYRANHSFDMTGSRMGMSQTFKGTWALDGKGNLCRTFVGDAPQGTRNPLCLPFAAHKLGDTWTMEANGQSRTFALKPGIQ